MRFAVHGKQSRQLLSDVDPWTSDKLKRKEFGQTLIQSIKQIDSPVTIGLIGPWGSGKTEFLKMLKADIEKRSAIMPVYFNAWARDFSNDPFASFCAEMHAEFVKNSKAKKAETKVKFKEKARKVIGTAVVGSIKILAKIGAQYAAAHAGIDPSTANAGSEVVESSLEKAAEKAVDAIAGTVQENIEKAPDTRSEFRSALGKIVSALGDDSTGGVCRLLVLVDEIDRCRPDFAIRLLETIKHFFDVPGVSFLIAYDEKYTISAAQALYGTSFDAENYLRRFIDIRFWLPRSDRELFSEELLKHYGFDSVLAPSRGGQLGRDLGKAIISWTVCLELTLRDAEQAFAACRLFIGANKDKVKEILYPCTFLCVARFALPEAVSAAANGEKFGTLAKLINERFHMSKCPSWRWLNPLLQHADTGSEQINLFLGGPAAALDASVRSAVSAAVDELGAPYGKCWRDHLIYFR